MLTKEGGAFIGVLGTLDASLMGNLLTGKGVKWSKISRRVVIGPCERTIRVLMIFILVSS